MVKLHFSAAVLFIASCVATTALAQAGRGTPAESKKTNRRPEATTTPTPAPAADEPAVDGPPDDGEVIKVETKIISIPVRVLDRKGRFVGGLTKESFHVFEDNKEQSIEYFSNEAQPFTVALVLDMSYSSNFKISEIQNAAISFIEQLRPQDRVMVVSFDGEVNVLCELTGDRDRIIAAIRSTKIATGTSLYEAMDLVINRKLRSIEGRKAIVLFTDGVDTTSRRVFDRDNLDDAMELDALIYPIRYDTYADVQRMKGGQTGTAGTIPIPGSGQPNSIPGTGQPGGLPIPGTSSPIGFPMPGGTTTTPPIGGRNEPGRLPFPIPQGGVGRPSDKGTSAGDYRRAEEYLDQMALRTGGQVYLATDYTNLTGAFAKIASELREFYSLGYTPSDDEKPGKVRRIKVKVAAENVSVRARGSYTVGERNEKK